MSEPSGMPSALGIEAVEWLARGEESLTVRVTGRWRRRRPAASPQPVLVIEAQGQRHRFPAMPEPPGLTGAAPGTWRMSFSVPASLAPALGGRVWLQLGAAVVPLPGAVDAGAPGEDPEAVGAAQPPDESGDPSSLAERPLPAPGLALQAAEAGAAEARALEAERVSGTLATQLEALQRQLQDARREPERLRAVIRAREIAVRRAQQLAHGERARRAELQEELSQRNRQDVEAIEDQLAAARERVTELEAEIEVGRRQLAEAEQLAAAAAASRDRAVHALAQAKTPTPTAPGMSLGRVEPASTLSRELSLVRIAPPPAPARSPMTSGEVRVLALALALERRLMATWTARAGPAEPSAPVRGDHGTKLRGMLAAVRLEVNELRALAERQRADRIMAETQAAELQRALQASVARGAAAYEAIDSLRRQLDSLRGLDSRAGDPVPARRVDRSHGIDATVPGAPGMNGGPAAASPPSSAAPAPAASPAPSAAPAPPAAGRGEPERDTEPGELRPELDPHRLDAALSRLREPPQPGVGAPITPPRRSDATATRAWIEPVFRALTGEDAIAAGRLLLALLPVARLVSADRRRYDLMLERLGCVHVTVPGGGEPVQVQLEPASTALTATDFTVRGDLASLARLVADGSLRRRFFHRRARITGSRGAARALLDLVRVPLGLDQWLGVGVTLDPWLACRLAALMVEPSWTVGESFAVAFPESGGGAGGVCLNVRDGAYAVVGDAGFVTEPTTTVTAPAGSVLAILAGDTGAATAIVGDHGALARLQSWIARAQNGA
jgi:hypothetical protein